MAKRRNQARQERKAAEQAADAQTKRRTRVVLVIVGFAVLAGVVATAYSFYSKRQMAQAVKTASYAAGMHVAGAIEYKESPPLGGPHNVVWQNCRIYDVAIHNEHAVHSMEHGAVWITYRPDLPADQVQRLKTLAADDFMLLSPYPGLDAPVVATSWNHQIALEGAADSWLPRFIAQYKNNPQTTPEFGALCVAGTSASALDDSLNSASQQTPQ